MSQLFPVVSDSDEFLYCARREDLRRRSLPHRTVWGMIYSPRSDRWLLQWRRATKDVCPKLWDMSCAGHVDCVDGQPESYVDAYQREIREELGLTVEISSRGAGIFPQSFDDAQRVPTIDLGYAKEYLECTRANGDRALEREHLHRFLSLYDGGVVLAPSGEPRGIAWMTLDEIAAELLPHGLLTPGLMRTLDFCAEALGEIVY